MSNLKKSNVFAVANSGDNIREGSQGSICNIAVSDNSDSSRYCYCNDNNSDNNQPNHCPVHPEPGNIFMSKRIGNTLYRVGVHFSPTNPDNKETLQDKILRLIKNDLNLSPLCAKMELPQTGRLLEGGSLL